MQNAMQLSVSATLLFWQTIGPLTLHRAGAWPG
jgi:hypothetical protein